MVSRNTTLVPSLGLRIGPACEAGLSVGMRRERVPPQRIKIKIKKASWPCGDDSWPKLETLTFLRDVNIKMNKDVYIKRMSGT